MSALIVERPQAQQPDREEERSWVTAAQAGDEEAFGCLFRAFYERGLRTAIGLMGDNSEAEEVAQEAWVKAWKRLDRFDPGSACFTTWFHRVLTNTALDALRRRKRERSRWWQRFGKSGREDEETLDPLETVAEGSPNPGERMLVEENRDRLMKILDCLPVEQRTVLVLKDLDGYRYEEIATMVGCPPGTVMSRLHLARKKVRRYLEEIENEP